jgi:hypothetical protein
MKIVCSLLLLFLINCSSFKDQIKEPFQKNDTVMSITYDNSLAQSEIMFDQDDETGILTIKNKDKTWKITYRDFKIMTLGYKNWRVVENNIPEISKITEDSKWVNFTFNYYKNVKSNDGTNAKVSILSGTVSISKKVIRTNEEEASNKTKKW